jgi:branched-chain amino acid transport system ATP-binding protein
MSVLEGRGISMSFGGNRVLVEVDIDVAAGSLVGLIGPNGAGKTTLLAVLSGLLRNTAGAVLLEGRNVGRLSPDRRARLGMARTFQRLELWGSMTVAQNIRTAAEVSSRHKNKAAIESTVLNLLDEFQLTEVADTRTADLPSGLGRVTEVARALACDPKVLLLDEPSAGLDDRESAALAASLRGVTASGRAVLLVEHHVEMVMSLSSKVYVLDYGRVIASGPPAEVRLSPEVQAAYLGAGHAAST